MSGVVKWDGFPVFGRDRDAWHLLRFENEEHPTPMWWDWRLEAWFTDPSARGGMRAEAAHETGFSYLAGTVTPSDLNDAIAEAVAAERERVAEFLNSSWAASSLDEEDISVTLKIKVPFVPHEKTVSTLLRAIRSAAK
ncbi:MAG: hypothetical protein ABF617_08065 [Gluconobacter japonicus]|uniref:hypothetical protein n=1 Tax=Gluconobacter japonicus TaxID=376620 RepID=UPI0039EB0778